MSSPKSSTQPRTAAHGIGTMQERSLHAALKAWYARPGDRLEVAVDGFLVDVVRDGLLIEIQTGNFSSIKRKLSTLTRRHCVRLVYPIARDKWIVRLADNGLDRLSRRRSPKHGCLLHLFEELVSIPDLIARKTFSLEVLMIQEEEVRRRHARGRWRRGGWGTFDRRLLAVVDRATLASPSAFRRLLPEDLDKPFTTAELSQSLGQTRALAQKMAYCLRKMGAVEVTGKRGNALQYST